MTSKISYSKLIKEDICHRGWLAALSCVLLLLCETMYTILILETSLSAGVPDQAARYEFLNVFPALLNGSYNLVLAGVLLLLAVLSAATGFSYLHSREKTDFYHSLPLSRQQWFFVSYLGGLLLFLVPYLAASLLAMLAGTGSGIMTAALLGASCKAVMGGILGFLLFYHLTILAMMLTGKPVTGILAAATLSVYGIMASSLGGTLTNAFFSTYADQGHSLRDKIYCFLSPWTMFAQLLASTAYNYEETDCPIIPYYFSRFFRTVDPKNFLILLAVTVLLLAALVFVSLLLYKKRPSEAAGNALAYPVTAPFIKVLISIPTALYLGLLIGSMYGSSKKWVILLSILSVILLCALIEFIYHMDLRRLFSGKYSSLLSLLAVAGILCILQFDLFGYDTWFPEENDLESMSFEVSQMYGYFYYPDDMVYNTDQTQPDLLNAKNCQIQDFEPVYELAREGVENHQNGIDKGEGRDGDQEEYVNVSIRYNRKSGKPVYRNYVVSKQHTLDTLSAVCREESYRKILFPIFYVDYDTVSAVWLSDIYMEPAVLELTRQQQDALLDAYKQDVLEVDIQDLQYEEPVGELSVDIPEARQSGDLAYFSRYNITLPGIYLYENYENSLALLEEYGYTIRREIDPEDVSQVKLIESEYIDTVDAYGNTISTPNSKESVITDSGEIEELLLQILYHPNCRILGNGKEYPRSIEILFKDNPEPAYFVVP